MKHGKVTRKYFFVFLMFYIFKTKLKSFSNLHLFAFAFFFKVHPFLISIQAYKFMEAEINFKQAYAQAEKYSSISLKTMVRTKKPMNKPM